MSVSTSRILELYHAVRLAYKSNYDFIKYNGKLGKSFDGESSPYYYTLLKIQKCFDNEDRIIRYFATLFLSGDIWITRIAEEGSLCIAKEYEKRENSLDQFFLSDVSKLAQKYPGKEGFKKLVQETEFNAPLFDQMMGGKIPFDTFMLIDVTCKASSNWKSRVWKSQEKRIWLTENLSKISLETKYKVKNIIISVFDLK